MLNFFKEYFNLSNNEQRGIIGLLLIILFLIIAPRVYFMMQPASEIPQNNIVLISAIQTENNLDNDYFDNKKVVDKVAENSNIKIVYFKFDPNTASLEDLMNLGFTEKTAGVLINFRNKGGKFYAKDDLKKVYGVSEQLYQNVKDYIDIPKKEFPKKEYLHQDEDKKEKIKSDYEKDEKKNFVPVNVNINTADSATLTSVKGIGATYASRIIKYRKLLGGFVTKEQVMEVYGVNKEMFDLINNQIFVSGEPNKININTATWQQLKSHPYISSDLANIILNYKKTHGNYESFTVLTENKLMDEALLKKLSPYLNFE